MIYETQQGVIKFATKIFNMARNWQLMLALIRLAAIENRCTEVDDRVYNFLLASEKSYYIYRRNELLYIPQKRVIIYTAEKSYYIYRRRELLYIPQKRVIIYTAENSNHIYRRKELLYIPQKRVIIYTAEKSYYIYYRRELLYIPQKRVII